VLQSYERDEETKVNELVRAILVETSDSPLEGNFSNVGQSMPCECL